MWGHPGGSRPELLASAAGLALGLALLALPLPLVLLGLGALLAGLAAGVPFAYVFTEAQRLRPDAPGAAIGFVNSWAISAVLVGTPWLGLTFSLPSEGRVGFAVAAVLAVAVLVAVPPRKSV